MYQSFVGKYYYVPEVLSKDRNIIPEKMRESRQMQLREKT